MDTYETTGVSNAIIEGIKRIVESNGERDVKFFFDVKDVPFIMTLELDEKKLLERHS